ncbi:prevent-host-death family protein [Gleimia sp. 6138-11-ORH1]|uniref:prevent-host-death family protein n=1 Tax=Gleimia sp. 6138-11-ORH1 TaxID=2973937 RepID=UPI00216A977F|nr:prevent-host-death family protein [Gleimia sp. 6138-11-ORH1]MCS4484968.1 prevent-host-death family protein [Gleimia sp. 6138-11-ORH1]
MVSNFFSRAKSVSDETQEVAATEAAGTEELVFNSRNFVKAVADWQAELVQRTRLDLKSLPARLTMTGAHPSGLAKLYAERETRLSSLIRDKRQLERAEESARLVYTTSLDTAISRGVSAIHLAWGLATWTENDTVFESPLLYRPVNLAFDTNGEVTVQLVGEVQVAPEILRAVRATGRDLNEAQLVASTRSKQGFYPEPVLHSLKSALGQVLADFTYTEFIEIAQFLHPAQSLIGELADAAALQHSPIIRGLAEDPATLQNLPEDAPEPNPRDRDPWAEIGIGDQLPEQLDNVEAIATGLNAILDTSGGADPTPTVASVLTAAAVNGKSSLYISANRRRTVQLWEYFAAQGLTHAVARVDASNKAAGALYSSLQEVFADDAVWADRALIEAQREQLRQIREALEKYTADLHQPHPAWEVSAYDALQVLTDLTSTRPGPRTSVRFSADTLTKLANDTDEVARNALLEAAEAGIFQVSDSVDAWFGAVISAPEQVTKVLERINTLVKDKLPTMRVNMSSTAGQTGLQVATTFVQWEEQLRMLHGVRDALDVFQPVIFEREVADMVRATASKQWRRDNGAEMQRSQRIRLVKQAQDMLRPGRYVEDLHGELKKVQKQREVWRRHCEAGGWPKVPANLNEMLAEATQVRTILEKLNPTLATAHGNLTRMDVSELGLLLTRLSQDPGGAAQIPSRLEILKKLHGFGLDAFIKDMRSRCVPTSLIEPELELAWWASALGVMLANMPSLGGFDPAKLQDQIVEFRRLDQAQVESLAALASDAIRRNRAEVLVQYHAEEGQLRKALADGVVTEQNISRVYRGSQLVRDLFPIAISSPALIPALYTLQDRIDLLVIDSVEDLPLVEIIPLLARARQVVVTADCAVTSDTVTKLQLVLTQLQIMPAPLRVNGQVSQLCRTYGVRHTIQSVPVPRLGSKLSVSFVDGRGMPAPDAQCIESTAVEVETVVDLVLEHGLMSPERSLAVVAANRIHAQRIRERLRTVMMTSPALADFFRGDVAEPFVILHPDTVQGKQRDKVIFALGYAKTPHGRVLHNFGGISQAGGQDFLATLLSVARDDLHIVSSVKADEFDRSRFSVPGALMLLDLLEMADAAADSGPMQWQVVQAEPDQLLIDLAERLYSTGLQVIPNVGGEGALRVPLAVGHPFIPGELLVAISTDDTVYVNEASLRRRDRYWPALLEKHGWKSRTELSMAVFIDPQKEADAIVELVLDAVDERLAADPALAAAFVEQAEAAGVAVGEPEADLSEGATETETAESDARETLDDAEPQKNETPQENQLQEPGAQKTGEAELEVVAGESEVSGIEVPVAESEVLEVASEVTEEVWQPVEGKPRKVRPAVAVGLPLAAYSDEQLDDIAKWILSDGVERETADLVKELIHHLELPQTGTQVEAVLNNVAQRSLSSLEK